MHKAQRAVEQQLATCLQYRPVRLALLLQALLFCSFLGYRLLDSLADPLAVGFLLPLSSVAAVNCCKLPWQEGVHRCQLHTALVCAQDTVVTGGASDAAWCEGGCPDAAHLIPCCRR